MIADYTNDRSQDQSHFWASRVPIGAANAARAAVISERAVEAIMPIWWPDSLVASLHIEYNGRRGELGMNRSGLRGLSRLEV